MSIPFLTHTTISTTTEEREIVEAWIVYNSSISSSSLGFNTKKELRKDAAAAEDRKNQKKIKINVIKITTQRTR